MTIATLLDQLGIEVVVSENSTSHQVATAVVDWMATTNAENASKTFDSMLESANENQSSDANEWSIRHAVLVGSIRRAQEGNALELSEKKIQAISDSYLRSAQFEGYRSLLLRALIAAKSPVASKVFAELFVTAPVGLRMCVEIFSDLLKLDGEHAEAMFPRLLDGLNNLDLASFVLDYANYVFRSGKIDPHPAHNQVTQLMTLLSNLAERLGKLQDASPGTEEDAQFVGKQVTQAVSLAVPLCDALGCIGDEAATASLNKALQVEHRRLRVEAAAALGRLGVEDAKLLLSAMASEPGERLRVLAYAEELGIIDEVDEQYSSIVARAEAEFVMYLSQPDQFGIAPQYVELLDQRELAWPGYEEPRNCYLFQFVYRFKNGDFTNVGIVGPLVKVVQADVAHLSHDDLYALFAGWHVDHPDILAIPAERTVGQDQTYLSRMVSSLMEADEYEDVNPVLLGKLLDQSALIASAHRGESDGWVIVSEDEIGWVPSGSANARLTAEDVFHLFVGRSLLRSFN